jgi:hypothetical protein
MIILRCPKRRASTENAPGPSRPIAAAIMITKKAANPESSKFGVGAGNHESATATPPKPMTATVRRVRNPANSGTPHAAASKPTTLAPLVWLLQPASENTP